MSELSVEASAPEQVCRNPECPTLIEGDEDFGKLVEPEMDSDHLYYECEVCGFAFGHQRISEGGDNCSIGVPEGVRRQASAGMEHAMAEQARTEPVVLQIGKRPE